MIKPEIHPMLNDKTQKDIIFIHSDGKEYSLSAGINPLNNEWMWWWSNSSVMYHGKKSDINNIVKDIQNKCTILFNSF